MTELALLEDGPTDAERRLLLAHGAGAAMDSPFLRTFVAMLTERDIATTRFEFDYMASRRVSPKRKPPPKAERLVQEYASAVEAMTLSHQIAFHWVSDGDHDLAPRGASGFTRRGNLEAAADAVAAFMS